MRFTIVSARRKDGKPGYRVHVQDGNNKLIFWTEVYKLKPSAQTAIALMKEYAASARVID